MAVLFVREVRAVIVIVTLPRSRYTPSVVAGELTALAWCDYDRGTRCSHHVPRYTYHSRMEIP